MKTRNVLTMVAVLFLLPVVAHAQEKRVTCADNTIVTSDEACEHHGGVQKPGGLNKAGQEVKKAAIDVKDEAKRTPKNVEVGAKTMGHNVSEAAGDVGSGSKKAAKKADYEAHEAAAKASKKAHKSTHPRTYKARCSDGTSWTGHSKSSACKDHGGVANWS